MSRSTKVAFASVAAILLSGYAALATDAENGSKLARKCSVCHGKIGISQDPEVPNIAGQHAFYLEKALKDYRSGAREDRRMTLMAKVLKDEEIKDLAAWFASIQITATAPN